MIVLKPDDRNGKIIRLQICKCLYLIFSCICKAKRLTRCLYSCIYGWMERSHTLTFTTDISGKLYEVNVNDIVYRRTFTNTESWAIGDLSEFINPNPTPWILVFNVMFK